MTRALKVSVLLFFVFSISNIFAQKSAVATLSNSFDTYRKSTLLEKLFVHTDRTFYLTGETLWLKVYYRDASFHTPLDVSKVAYIELIDEEHKSVQQAKINLSDGNGNGSIFLPSSLNSGHYILRAYTSWMRNFDSRYYYEQTLTIVNPFTKLGLKPLTHITKYDVQFFPEGGHLVNGLPNTVAFRITDQNGKGANLKGAILDEANDTIVSFKPHKFGIGRLEFLPAKDHQYHAVLIGTRGSSITYALPPILEQGFTLHLTDTLDDKIQVVVSAKLLDPIPGTSLHLFLHTQQKNILTQTRFLEHGKTTFILDKKDLAEGISHLTVFDASLMPLCERLYYKEQKEHLAISIELEQPQYQVRKKVNLTIRTALANEVDTTADMSISVFKLDSLQHENTIDIKSYLLLTSELKGAIESPAYYVEEASAEKLLAIDNLMLTHGWSRFRWDDILKAKKTISFIPEYSGHIIHAKVINSLTGKPAKSIATYFSSPGKITRLYISKSNHDGLVAYELQDFYGNADVIIQTNAQLDSIYKIELLSPFSTDKTSVTLPTFNLSENLKNDLQQRSIHMQAQNIFYEDENNRFSKKIIDTVAFYGTPDIKYDLDKYTRFPTMEEVLREYIPSIAVRKRKDGFHLMNYDVVNKSLFKDDPLVLIDGIPVFDIDKLMAVDPRKIKTLEAMTRKYYLGPSSFYGINSFKTYNGDLTGFAPDTKSLVTNYPGVQLQQEFYSPKYELKQNNTSNRPDTRNVVYWSPSIKPSNKGNCHLEFFTPDIAGKYRVIVEGITKDGKPGSASSTFEVKEKISY